MILNGLPDFGSPLPDPQRAGGAGHVWRAFEGEGWLSAASALMLAEDRGRPDVQVSLYRPFLADGGPAPFGHLDIVFRTDHDDARHLAVIRETDFAGRLRHAQPAGGQLQLIAAAADAMDPSLAATQAVHPLAAERIRFSARLTPDGASQIAHMIEAGTMPVTASLMLRYDGVSPRLPETVVFEPHALLAALHQRMESDSLSLAGLALLIEDSLSDLPLERVGLERLGLGHDGDNSRLSLTLADRIAARFGDLDNSLDGTIRLIGADAVPPSRFSWDLSMPVKTARWVHVASDPFAPLRGADAAGRAARHVSRHEMPLLATGGHRVWAYANCPVGLEGMERLGVVLRAPSNPPRRPHPISTAMMFDTEAMAQTQDLFLSPGEPFAVDATGFAIIHDAAGVRRLEGPARPVPERGALMLRPADFGLKALTFEAAPDLLRISDAKVSLSYWSAGHQTHKSFTMTRDRPDVALALPLDATEPDISVSLVRSSGEQLSLGAFLPGHVHLDLAAIPEYGAHEVLLICPDLAPGQIVAIDIAPAGHTLDRDAHETLSFSADQTRRLWRYFASDPFRPGFSWRFHNPDQPLFFGWQDEPLSERLTINAPPPPPAQERARGDAPKISLTVDYGNGVRKVYAQQTIADGATIHQILESAHSWEPPLRCEVKTRFTDRGGQHRNYLAKVDGLPGAWPGAGAAVWRAEADGAPIDLDTPSAFALRNQRREPPPPVAGGTRIMLRRETS